jgi:hypothetical protein
VDIEGIVGMIESRRTAAYKAAQTDATGCHQAMALEYEQLLAEIAVQRQNHEKSIETE